MLWFALFLVLCVPLGFAGLYIDKLFEQRARRQKTEHHLSLRAANDRQARLWNEANEP